MVDIANKYELNHIYFKRLSSAGIAIGAANAITWAQIVLFEKSLALTSDLKRLPILRSMSIAGEVGEDVHNNMAASAPVFLTYRLYMINEDLTEAQANDMIDNAEIEEHDCLWAGYLSVYYNGSLGSHIINMIPTWDYEGGILLNSTITLVARLDTNINVAGTAFPEAQVSMNTFLEVDWAPITKTEFKDYILENVYAKDID